MRGTWLGDTLSPARRPRPSPDRIASPLLPKGAKGSTLFLLGTLACLALGCNRGGDPAAPDAKAGQAAAPTAAPTVAPARKALVRVVEQPGTILAFEEATLHARVPGYLKSVKGDIGDPIRGPKGDAPGQLLAEIAVPEIEEEANQRRALARQAAAEVDQAKAALAASEANVASYDAAVVEAKAHNQRWEAEAKRTASLATNGVVDPQTRDETLNQYRAASARVQFAEAGVRKALADRDKAKADLRVAEARIAVVEAETRRVEAMLAYASIRAPFDGVVTRRSVNQGDLVQPNLKSEGLFHIARIDRVRVAIAVPEVDAELVREKAEAKLIVPALGSAPFVASVTRTSWALEGASRSLRAEIDLPNPDGRFRPGMFVATRLSAPLAESWTLPLTAVARQGDVAWCFVAEGGKAVKYSVDVGRSDGTAIQVLRLRKGTDNWSPWAGSERVAVRASHTSEGQALAGN